MSGFEDCISDHLVGGVITPDEGEDLLKRYREDMKTVGRKGAQDALSISLALKAKIKRMDNANKERVIKGALQNAANYRDAFGRTNIIAAFKEMFEGTGYAGFKSAVATQQAYMGIANSMAADALELFHRTVITGKRKNANLNLELNKALHGEPCDPAVKAAAEGLTRAMDFMVDACNQWGGFIPKRKNYAPQGHDSNAVAHASDGSDKSPQGRMKAWSKFIDPLLDWSQMYDAQTGELFDMKTLTRARKDSILKNAFFTIVSNGASDIIPSLRPRGLGMSSSTTDHRFFVFKDATSQEKYNVEFGTGDALTSVMSHLHSLAREAGLKQVFGPSPEAFVEWMKQVVLNQGELKMEGSPNLLDAYKNDIGKLNTATEKAAKVFDAYFHQLRGEKSSDNMLTFAGNVLSNWLMGSLLGSSSIPHFMANHWIQALQRQVAGMPWANTIPHLLASFGSSSHKEMLYAALDNEDAAFNIGSGARQRSTLSKIESLTKYLPDRTTHWSGLMAVVDANKASFNKDLMAFVGRNIQKPWANVDKFLKDRMMANGITEKDWKLWQLAKTYQSFPGGPAWVRAPEILEVGGTNPGEVLNTSGNGVLAQPELEGGPLSSDAMARAADIMRESMVNYVAFLKAEQAIAVPQGSIRVRATIVGKDPDKGTWRGFLGGSTAMFKGFIGAFMIQQFEALMRAAGKGYQRAGNLGMIGHGAAYVGKLVVPLTVMGAVTLQLKTMSTGKDPMSMDIRTPEGITFWTKALLTGGALGIFGDFLASDHSSYGHGFLETLAGPVAAIPMDTAMLAVDTVKNLFTPNTKEVPASLKWKRAGIKAMRNMTPFLSTFAPTRAAYQRWVMDPLQEWADPLAHAEFAKQQVRLEKETGQQMWWRPGEMLPDRWPKWTAH